MSEPVERCGFFGTSGTVSETDLRNVVRDAAVAERDHWFDGAVAIDEQEDKQFGHLVRYWLAIKAGIQPTTLTYMQGKATDGSMSYGTLATGGASNHDFETVRNALLLGAPDGGSPANLEELVESALRSAYESGQANETFPWSAVFVISCIRGTAIKLGLEDVSNPDHGNVLLKAHEGHRVYVKEAYKRRISSPPTTGTYQAFRPDEHPVEVGDIVVGDREKATTSSTVVDLDHIPDNGYKMHGDIVVDVRSDYAETIGGNIGYSDPRGGDHCDQPDSKKPFSVRRRRYSLTAAGKLVVDANKRFVQEDNNGNLPASPEVDCPVGAGVPLHQRSLGRIFALLKPAERCETS